MSRRVLNISREGDSTTSLGSLVQGSVTFGVKKFFLVSFLQEGKKLLVAESRAALKTRLFLVFSASSNSVAVFGA